MITEKQKQVIKLLINVKEGYNINQIARLTGLSASWTYETLKQLEKQGYLAAIKLGNAVFFRINWNDIKTQKLVELILIEDGNKQLISESKYKVVEEKQDITEQVKVAERQESGNFYKKQEQVQVSTISYGPGSVETGASFSYAQRTQQQTGAISYNVAPIGQTGVNSVLGAYASAGAFSSYASSSDALSKHYGSKGAVPPETLGSRISSNVASFSLKEHTSSHVNSSVSGCKYCGPTVTVN